MMIVTESMIIQNAVSDTVKEVEVVLENGLKPLVSGMNHTHHLLMSRILLQGLYSLLLILPE